MVEDHVVLRLEIEEMRATMLQHLMLRQKDLETKLNAAIEEALRSDVLTASLARLAHQTIEEMMKTELSRALKYEIPRDPRFLALVKEIVARAVKPD